VKPHLPSPENRGFTGIKYYRITGGAGDKEIYQRDAALQAAAGHAGHFLNERMDPGPAARRAFGSPAARRRAV
jgi:1,4-alpha-glucan branching enzyme